MITTPAIARVADFKNLDFFDIIYFLKVDKNSLEPVFKLITARFFRNFATFRQNFAAVSGILQKILPKNEPKFVEKRAVMSLKTGSRVSGINFFNRFFPKFLNRCFKIYPPPPPPPPPGGGGERGKNKKGFFSELRFFFLKNQ